MKCLNCGKEFVRRKTEAIPVFAKRKTCSRECGNIRKRQEGIGWHGVYKYT